MNVFFHERFLSFINAMNNFFHKLINFIINLSEFCLKSMCIMLLTVGWLDDFSPTYVTIFWKLISSLAIVFINSNFHWQLPIGYFFAWWVFAGAEGRIPAPGMLNVKTGPPLTLSFGFSILLVFSKLFFGVGYFSGDLGFQYSHPHRTVARKSSISGLYLCAGGLECKNSIYL